MVKNLYYSPVLDSGVFEDDHDARADVVTLGRPLCVLHILQYTDRIVQVKNMAHFLLAQRMFGSNQII
jgi:hypothetical protein